MGSIFMATIGLVLTLATGCDTGPSAADWVEQAVQAHEGADRAIEAGDFEEARNQLIDLLQRPAPDDLAESDRRAVLQDVYFRLGAIELALERPADALSWSEAGLEMGRSDDLFTANLLVVRGRAQEALGHDDAAAADYYDALRINEDLLRRSFDTNEPEDGR